MSGLSNQTLVAKDNRGFRSWTRRRSTEKEKPLPLKQQIALQLVLIGVLITVLFPILWIFSLSIDPRNLFRPEGLNLIPPGASLDAYAKILTQPTSNDISFLELMLNSLKIALGTATVAVGLGILAAYAFSRLKFRGREILMIVILGVLMLPSVATLIPLYVFLNQFRIEAFGFDFNLRASLLGVMLAITSARCRSRSGTSRATWTRSRTISRRRPSWMGRPRTRRSPRSSCRWPPRRSP